MHEIKKFKLHNIHVMIWPDYGAKRMCESCLISEQSP